MTDVGCLTLEDAAHELAGNWQKFDSFAWFRRRELDDAAAWAVIYLTHRDSGLLAQSNGKFITKRLEPFADGDQPDVVFESHSHWAVAYLDGFSIRAFRNGEVTEAFRAYHETQQRLDSYPILDEEDYSRREYDATIANIGQAAHGLGGEFELPDGWEGEVYSWLLTTNQRAVENRDDHGGYPGEDDLRAALDALGYPPVCDAG